MPMKFTEEQGQYLAFIHYYTKLHLRPPAEADSAFDSCSGGAGRDPATQIVWFPRFQLGFIAVLIF